MECFRENSPVDSQMIVVGNKIDLGGKEMEKGELEDKLKQDNVGYLEVSAKTNANIELLTERLIKCIKDENEDANSK
jgi:50S ribosomal subunit-associated GTPase HflX